MKSIKTMFLMSVVGMTFLTSCNSETEQTQEKEIKYTNYQRGTELTEDQKKALDLAISEIEGSNTYQKEAEVKCTKGMAAYGNVYYNSCVTVNGQMYSIDLTYHNGDLIGWHCTPSTYCDCNFD